MRDDVRAVIDGGHLAHFTTVNRDGSPHTTVVWVGTDGDEIVIGKLFPDKKVRNLTRDPRCSVSVEADGDSNGLRHYLVVEGTARVVPGGAPAWLAELAKRYIGPDAVFPRMPDPPDGFLIRVTPVRVKGIGPWADG